MKASIAVAVAGTALLVAACSQNTITDPGSGPAQLLIASGDGQTGAAGAALPAPLGVMAIDNLGHGVSGVQVTFAAPSGTFGNATVTTDAHGMAQTSYTLGATPGDVTVTATATGVAEPATFTEAGS